MVRVINTDQAPGAVGAYSQATTDEDLVFTAGQIPATPDGEIKADSPVREQTERALDNLLAVLDAEELDTEDILKTTIFLDNIDDFEEMNEAYSDYFDTKPPARSALEVGNLPKGVSVEIEAIASNK